MTKQKLLKAKRLVEIHSIDISEPNQIVKFLSGNDFTKAEAEEFLSIAKDPEADPIYNPLNPNLSIDNNVDYSRLHTKEGFEKYNKLLNELSPEEGISFGSDMLFEFELYRMLPVRAERYPGLPNSPIDFIGVQFKETEPVPLAKTRITIKQARTYNEQILNAHGIAGYGKYYLLKKVK